MQIQKNVFKTYKRILFDFLFGRGRNRTQDFVAEEYDVSWRTAEGCLPQQHYKVHTMRHGNTIVLRRGIDYLKHSIEELAGVIRSLAPDSVLELGSGDGFITTSLAAKCQSPYMLRGIDFTKGGVEIANKNLKQPIIEELVYVTEIPREEIMERLRTKDIQFLEGNMLSLPFEDNSFDLVFSRVAMEQLPRDYFKAFKEAARVTKKYAVFVEEFKEAQKNIFQHMHLRNSDYFRASVFELQKAGFEVIRFEPLTLSKIKFRLGLALCKKRGAPGR